MQLLKEIKKEINDNIADSEEKYMDLADLILEKIEKITKEELEHDVNIMEISHHISFSQIHNYPFSETHIYPENFNEIAKQECPFYNLDLSSNNFKEMIFPHIKNYIKNELKKHGYTLINMKITCNSFDLTWFTMDVQDKKDEDFIVSYHDAYNFVYENVAPISASGVICGMLILAFFLTLENYGVVIAALGIVVVSVIVLLGVFLRYRKYNKIVKKYRNKDPFVWRKK